MAGHWAVPYVAYASNAGIINGYEDGTFRPTAPVSYGEVIKMIVCTMGYGDVANKNLLIIVALFWLWVRSSVGRATDS